MHNIINEQFHGAINTPNLWMENSVYNLQQSVLSKPTGIKFNQELPKNIRLGKRVEQFLFYQLMQEPQVSILGTNLQIQQEKHTLGEMDALVLIANKPVHLEIIYKFYVFDDSVETTELLRWIGPNKQDSLIQKLDKLKNKQLPLLYHPETSKYLEKFNLNAAEIQQQVIFKAQLFVPYNKPKPAFTLLNPACVVGHSIKKELLPQFKTSKFYIPRKENWLLEPHPQVDWLLYETFMEALNPILEDKTSPLVWIKQNNGELSKCFVLWW